MLYFIGNGYCRSEGIVAVYLQKESVAKRIYCTVIHSKNNSDGNKSQGNVLFELACFMIMSPPEGLGDILFFPGVCPSVGLSRIVSAL